MISSILHQSQESLTNTLNHIPTVIMVFIILSMIVSFFAFRYYFKWRKVKNKESVFDESRFLKVKIFKRYTRIDLKWLHRGLWFVILFFVVLILILSGVFIFNYNNIHS